MCAVAPSGDVTVLTGVHLAGQDPTGPHDIVITGSVITSISPNGAQRPPRGARLVDARGSTATPGLIDGHSHWLWGASRHDWLDLQGIKTLGALQGPLADRRRAIGPGEWLLAHGLEYTPFSPEGGPHRKLIDDAAGDGLATSVSSTSKRRLIRRWVRPRRSTGSMAGVPARGSRARSWRSVMPLHPPR